MSWTVSVLALLLLVIPAKAQVFAEELAELMSGVEEELDDEIAEQLSDWQRHPLDINQATAEDLRRFRLITDLQIGFFLHYREMLGPFIDLHELQAVPGWPVALIKKILPYLTVKTNEFALPLLRQRLRSGDHLLLTRWGRLVEKPKGYKEPKTYAGSRDKLLIKYRYKYRDLVQYGFAAEKDAGESLKKGFDFYSFHLLIKTSSLVKMIAVGDFCINLGQGLVQWNSMGAGKGSEVIQVKQQAGKLRPYTSSMESNFQRGAAAVLQKRKWEGLIFISALKVSGNLTNDTSAALSAITLSGLHRTQAELDDRKNTRLVKAGGSLGYHARALRAGISAMMTTLSKPLIFSASPHRALMPTGKSSIHYSADLSYTWRNMHVFGEAATTGTAPAFLVGAMVSVDRKADFAFLLRHIHPRYYAPSGNAFTESSTLNNEKGLYAGLNIRPFQTMELKFYADLFHFSFLRYRQHGPARGYEVFSQVHYRPAKHTDIYIRWKKEEKMQNGATDRGVQPLVAVRQDHIRLHFASQLSRTMELRGRAEVSVYEKESEKEHGYLCYLEGRFRLFKSYRLQLRLQSFETTGYNSRIYVYEQDLLYASSIPSFSNEGLRYYIVLRMDLMPDVELSFKLAQTIHSDLKATGSGLELVEGSRRTDVKLQLTAAF